MSQDINVFVSKSPLPVKRGVVEGSTLIRLAKVEPHQHLLLDVGGELDVPIASADLLILEGGEQFAIGEGEPQQGDNPCRREPLHFKVNGKVYAATKAKYTAAEIKAMLGASYAGDRLWCDPDYAADVQLRDEQRIILTKRDCFITNPCGNVGFDSMATQFAEVKARWPLAELHQEAGNHLLVIPGWSLESHWSATQTDLLVWIPNGYPAAALDMFYVLPHITLKDGRMPAGSDCSYPFLGKTWQRFSWHYQRQWLPQSDTLVSHLHFCKQRLQQAQ